MFRLSDFFIIVLTMTMVGTFGLPLKNFRIKRETNSADNEDEPSDPCKRLFPCFNMGKCQSLGLDYKCECYEDYFDDVNRSDEKTCSHVIEKCPRKTCDYCSDAWAGDVWCFHETPEQYYDPLLVVFDPSAISGHPYFIYIFTHPLKPNGVYNYHARDIFGFDTGEGIRMQTSSEAILTVGKQQLLKDYDLSRNIQFFQSTAARTFIHRRRLENPRAAVLHLLLFYTYHSKDTFLNVNYYHSNIKGKLMNTKAKVHVLDDPEECSPEVLMIGCSGHAAGFYERNSTEILWDYREGHTFRPYILQKCAKENSTLRIVWVTHDITINISTGFHEDFAVKGTRKKSKMDPIDSWNNIPALFVPPKYEHAVIELLVYETVDSANVKNKISFYNSVQCQINTYPRVPITVVWGGSSRTHARGDPLVVDIRNSFMPWTENPYYWPNNTDLKHYLKWRICLEIPLKPLQYNDEYVDMEYLERDLNKGCRKTHYIYHRHYNMNFHRPQSLLEPTWTVASSYFGIFPQYYYKLIYELKQTKGYYTTDLAKEWYEFTHYTMDWDVPSMNEPGDPRAVLTPEFLSSHQMSRIEGFNISIKMYYSNVYTEKFGEAKGYTTMLENRGIEVKLITGSGFPLLNIRCLRNCGMGGPWIDNVKDEYITTDDGKETRTIPNSGIGDDLMIDTTMSSALLVECIERCLPELKNGSYFKWELFTRASGRNGTLKPVNIDWKNNNSPQFARVLCLKEGTLKKNQTYVFRVTPNIPQVEQAKAEFLTQIQGGFKKTGKCSFKPQKGISGVTEFELTCADYEKDYVVSNLMYEFYQVQTDENGTTDEILLEWTFHSSVNHIVLATSGKKEKKNQLKMVVLDSFGNNSTVVTSIKLSVMNDSKLEELATDTNKPHSLPLRANAKDEGGVVRLSSALVDAIRANASLEEEDKKKYLQYIINGLSQAGIPCIDSAKRMNGVMKKVSRIVEDCIRLEDGFGIMRLYVNVALAINEYSKHYWAKMEKVKYEIVAALEALAPVMIEISTLGFEEGEEGNETFDVYDDLREIADIMQAKYYSDAAYEVVTNLGISQLNRLVENEEVKESKEDYYFHCWVNMTGPHIKDHGDHVVKLTWEYNPPIEELVGFQILRIPSDIFWWSSYFQHMKINSHLLFIYLELRDYFSSSGKAVEKVNTPSTFVFNITKEKVKIVEVKGTFFVYDKNSNYAQKVQIYRFSMKEGQHLLINFTDCGVEPLKVIFTVNRWPKEEDFEKEYFTVGSTKNLTASELKESQAKKPNKKNTGGYKRKYKRKRQTDYSNKEKVNDIFWDEDDDDEDYDELRENEFGDTSKDTVGVDEYGNVFVEDEQSRNVVAGADDGVESYLDGGLEYKSGDFGGNIPSMVDENASIESDIYITNLQENYEIVETMEKNVKLKVMEENYETDDLGEDEEADEMDYVEVRAKPAKEKKGDSLDTAYIIGYTDTPKVMSDSWVYMGVLPFQKELKEKTTFAFKPLISSCQEWMKDRWRMKRCEFNITSKPWFITCKCSETYFRIYSAASYTAKGSWFIPSEEVDFVAVGSLTPREYYVDCKLIIAIVLFLFVCLFVWAFFSLDQYDKERRRIIVLPDNSMDDKHGYLVTVYTGSQKDSGTSSTIGIQLFGSVNDSERHLLHSDKTETLQSGSVDWFMLYTTASLGDIEKIHIWSNAQGHRQAWYCNHIVIRDLQLRKVWIFMVERWISLAKGDGMINFRLRPSPKRIVYQKDRVFLRNLIHFAGEGHMWFSIFTNHPRSFYSSAERVLVCALGTFVNIFMTILLYRIFVTDVQMVVYGVAKLEPGNLLSALVCSGCCVPLTFIFAFIFRKSSPLSLRLCKADIPQVKHDNVDAYAYYDVEKRGKLKRKKIIIFYLLPTDALCESHRSFERRAKLTALVPKETCKKHKFKNKKKIHYHTNHFFLPAWVRILAWCLCILIIGVLVVLSVLLGRNKKEINSLEWLSTIFLMISFSILIIEPIKAVITAFVATFIVEVQPIDYDMERGYPLWPDVGTLQTDNVLILRRALQDYAPIPTWYIPGVRAQEKARVNQGRKTVEMVCVILFVSIVCLLVNSYITKRRMFYLHNEHIKQLFVNGSNGTNALDKFKIQREVYNYLENTYIPLFKEAKSTSEPNELLRDDVNILVGMPRLRQLRVKTDSTCPGSPAQEYLNCVHNFNMDNIDQKTYYMGWSDINPPEELYSERAREQFWKYHYHNETQSAPITGEDSVYPGGGYIADLGRYIANTKITIDYLKRNNWLNDYTSFVVLELCLYNNNNGLLSLVNILFEKDAGGYLNTNHLIRTVNLKDYPVTESLLMELGFAVALCVLIYYQLLCLQVYPIRRHFQDWWTIYDLLLVFVSVASISMYLLRRAKILQMFYRIDRHDENQYVSIVDVYIINEIFLKCVAVLVLLATIRAVKVFMNLYWFRMMEITLYVEVITILFVTFFTVVVLFSCCLTAFIALGYKYQVFRKPISGIGTVTATLFGVNQGVFSIHEIWFVQMTFCIIIAVSIIIVNMYKAVLLEAYTTAKVINKRIYDYGFCDYFEEEYNYHCKLRRRMTKMKTRRLRGGSDVADDSVVGKRRDPSKQIMGAMPFSSRCEARWMLVGRNKRIPLYVTHADPNQNPSDQDKAKEDIEGRNGSVENLRSLVQTVTKKETLRKRVSPFTKTVGTVLTQSTRDIIEKYETDVEKGEI